MADYNLNLGIFKSCNLINMQLYFFMSLILAVLVGVFVFQNIQPVSVRFLTFHTQGIPLALVILFSLLCGALLTFCFTVSRRLQDALKIRNLEAKIKEPPGLAPASKNSVLEQKHD